MAKSERIRLLTPTFRVSVPDVFVKRVFQGQGKESGRYPQRIKTRLAETRAGYRDMLISLEPSGDAKRVAALKDVIKIHELEFEHFVKRSA
jgi:hypothetical protein